MRNILSIILCLYAFFVIVSVLPYFFMVVLAIAMVGLPVYLLYRLFKRIDEIEIEEEVKDRPMPENLDIYAKLYRALDMILRLKATEKDPDLQKVLLSSRESVVILKDEDYQKYQSLLKSFLETYVNYLDLFRMPRQTEAVREAKQRTRASIFQIAIALEKMVEGQMKPDLEKVDIQNEVLDDQLKNSGLMPSDFDKVLR